MKQSRLGPREQEEDSRKSHRQNDVLGRLPILHREVRPTFDPKVDDLIEESQAEHQRPGNQSRQVPAQDDRGEDPDQCADEDVKRVAAHRRRMLYEHLGFVPRPHAACGHVPELMEYACHGLVRSKESADHHVARRPQVRAVDSGL